VSSCIGVLLLNLVRVKEGTLLGAATLFVARAPGGVGSLNQGRHLVLFIVEVLEHLPSGDLGSLPGLAEDLGPTFDHFVDRPIVHLLVFALALLRRSSDRLRHTDERIGSLSVSVLWHLSAQSRFVASLN
jgi:hypothetical protein